MSWIMGNTIRVADPLQPDRKFTFPATTKRMRKRARKIGSKEPGTVRWLHDTLRPGDIFFDVGANVGIYSIFAAARIGSGHVFSFEPHAGNFAQLLESICLNGMGDRITPLSVALDAKNGCIDFAYRELRAGSTGSQLASSPLLSAQRSVAVVERKFTYAVDEMNAVDQLPAPTVVKIDVDGGELNILRGMRLLLIARAVRSLQVEIDPSQDSAIRQFMEQVGYRDVHSHLSRAGQQHLKSTGKTDTWPYNLIFEPAAADGVTPTAGP
jgi:FkbM family methyltransferase